MKWIARHWRMFLLLVLVPLLAIALANVWVLARGSTYVFHNLAALPRNDVGLVLGTSPKTSGGFENPFFAGRIAAAAELYKAGKVRRLLLSGDNRTRQYDEPSRMRDALVAKGVPSRVMTLDYAGLRTLDSLVRAKEVFGLKSVTIITDDFHAARAVFLSRQHHLQGIAFCSRRVPWASSKKTRMREIASRVVACLDVYVLGTEPRFLGKKEKLAGE